MTQYFFSFLVVFKNKKKKKKKKKKKNTKVKCYILEVFNSTTYSEIVCNHGKKYGDDQSCGADDMVIINKCFT